MAYLGIDSVMSQSLEEILEIALKRDCPDVIEEARAISVIMLQDGKTLDWLGAYYSMNRSFESKEQFDPREVALGQENFVEVIKRRDPGYDNLTFDICTAMYRLSCDYWYQKEYHESCRGEKWMAVGDACSKRGWWWDHTIEDEKEAITNYSQMVEEAGLKPKGSVAALLAQVPQKRQDT